jgi:two-component system sensor histidine kinase AdeS
MAVVALGITLLSILGSYAFWALLLHFSPGDLGDPNDLTPGVLDWAWMALTAIVAVALAVVFAVKLAQRILVPLNSVAESLRQLAAGDLTIRAHTDDHSLGEAAQLVVDFNVTAERLESMARERAFWNAAIAHELRTPVTILRGRLQGLAEGVFAPNPVLFSSLLAQVEGLSRLIEDLRVVGLADSGHLELRLAPTDLAGDVRAVVAALDANLHAAGFDVSLELFEGKVHCDAVRIRQALLALLENTLRHANPGPLTVHTEVSGGRYRLQVIDSGPGVDEAMARRVFEAFVRGTENDSGKKAGSGLGLAIVRAIAQAHRGEAKCRPAANGGTLFELNWPA